MNRLFISRDNGQGRAKRKPGDGRGRRLGKLEPSPGLLQFDSFIRGVLVAAGILRYHFTHYDIKAQRAHRAIAISDKEEDHRPSGFMKDWRD